MPWVFVRMNPLAHLSMDKMAAISETFLEAFLWMKKHEYLVCSQGFNWQYSNICSDNALAPTRRKALSEPWKTQFTDVYMLGGMSQSVRPLIHSAINISRCLVSTIAPRYIISRQWAQLTDRYRFICLHDTLVPIKTYKRCLWWQRKMLW